MKCMVQTLTNILEKIRQQLIEEQKQDQAATSLIIKKEQIQLDE